MTPYGLAILMTLATGFLPWSYVFEGLGNPAKAKRLPLILGLGFVVFSTLVYAMLLVRFAPDGRGWPMIVFLTVSMQIGSIALGGVAWSITGQGLARRFLDAPLIGLLIALVCSLLALALGLIFTPST